MKKKKKKLEKIEKKDLNQLINIMKKKQVIENKKLEQNFSTRSQINKKSVTRRPRKRSLMSAKIKNQNKLLSSIDLSNMKGNTFKNKMNEYNYEIDIPSHISKK